MDRSEILKIALASTPDAREALKLAQEMEAFVLAAAPATPAAPAAAKARGYVPPTELPPGDKRRRMPKQVIRTIRALRAEGAGCQAIAKAVGFSSAAVAYRVRQMEQEARQQAGAR